MEYTTKEFAAALDISDRTVEGWRISRKGKPPVLSPARRNEKNQAVYDESQLEIARTLLNRNQKTTATSPSLFDNDPPYNKPVEDAETTAETANEEKAPVPVTIDADAQIVPTDETSPVTLDQRADKIRRLQADVQRGMIEIGLELIAAKAEIGHGKWTAWLETEFDWTDRTARYFMAVAERFGNRNTYSDLKPSTLKAMLTLPEGDEQAFIDAQAEAGKPVAEQSAREIQRNVKEWNEQRKPKNPPVKEQTHVEEPTAAQVDDTTGKLIVGDKPLDSCRGFVCIDETTDEKPDRPDDDDDLSKARAQAENALEAVSAAIMQTSDCDALKAVTEALNAIAAELDAKKLARNRREQKGNQAQ